MELRDLLISSDIDILAVQEWKLQKTDKTPFTEGYTTICKDQANILGGGLLIFIRTDIVFEKLNSVEKLVWRSFPSISRLLSQLGLNFTTCILQTPQLNILHSALH